MKGDLKIKNPIIGTVSTKGDKVGAVKKKE